MDLIDDIDPVSPFCRRILDLFPDIPDILHTVVGGRIDLNHVHGRAPGDRLADRADIAGAPIHWLLTVHRFSKDLRDAGLTGASCAAEQVGMAYPPGHDLIF